MESINYGGNYMETELSDSIVLIEDLPDSNGDSVNKLCDSDKVYHSCYIGRRDNQPEDGDDDNGAGEAISTSMNERGTPDGKSDTDVDEDEDVVQKEMASVTLRNDEDDEDESEDEDEDEDEDEEEEEEEEGEVQVKQVEIEYCQVNEEENVDEEEHIEVRTPQWTENQILTNSDTASADSSSTSECESKSTSISFVDDSLLVSASQQADGQIDNNVMTLTDFSDLEDKTDLSSFQELTNDTNDEIEDQMVNDQQLKKSENFGGPIVNEGFDTIENQLIASNHRHHHHHHHHQTHRVLKGSTEETVGLLNDDNEDKVNPIEDDQLVQVNPMPLIYLENPLIATGINDDQASLVTKHAAYQRHAIKLNGGVSCSASASSASTSSTTSRTIARRMVKSSGKAVKSFSKKLSKLFK